MSNRAVLRLLALALVSTAAAACSSPTATEDQSGSAAAISNSDDAASSASAPSGKYTTTQAALTQNSLIYLTFDGSGGCTAVKVNVVYMQTTLLNSIPMSTVLSDSRASAPAKCTLDTSKKQITVAYPGALYGTNDWVFTYRMSGSSLIVTSSGTDVTFTPSTGAQASNETSGDGTSDDGTSSDTASNESDSQVGH